jgi:two-component system, NarL family, sensor histidine kinase NreB
MVSPLVWLARPSALPLRVFGTVMILAFLVEVGVMLLLPSLVTGGLTGLQNAIIDALLLTTVLAPAVWYVVARPLRKLHDDRGQLLARVFETQENERCALARDLHDELGQHLTALRLAVRSIERATTAEQIKERTATMNTLVATSQNSVHMLAKGLRPVVLEEFGLVPAIERFCEEFQRTSGTPIDLDIDIKQGTRFEGRIETCIYRVLQESLTNVARHAKASRVRVSLSRQKHELELCVTDNGSGFNPRAQRTDTQSFGLRGIQERAELADGFVSVDSSSGTGTTITLRVPAGS